MILWVGRRRVAVPAVAPGLAVVAALAVQVCRPGGADLMVGVVAPLIVLAVGASGPGGTSRGLVSAVLAVQAALHVGCAVGLAPVPVHVAAGGWHLLLAALSVLLVRVGEQSLAAVLVVLSREVVCGVAVGSE